MKVSDKQDGGMADIEAVARADFDAVREIVKQLHVGDGDQMQTFTKITGRIFDTLQSLGWKSPAEVQEIAQAAEAQGLERAATRADVIEGFQKNAQSDPDTSPHQIPHYAHGELVAMTIKNASRALKPDAGEWQRVPEGIECIAFQTYMEDSDGSHVAWIASTVDHDIMQQGRTFEDAKQKLLIALHLDHQGLATKSNPAVKTFRAMIKEVKR